MSDKRKQMRVDVAVRLPVIDVNTGVVVGDLANISTAGFMVLSHDPRPAQLQLHRRLDRPGHVSQRDCGLHAGLLDAAAD